MIMTLVIIRNFATMTDFTIAAVGTQITTTLSEFTTAYGPILLKVLGAGLALGLLFWGFRAIRGFMGHR